MKELKTIVIGCSILAFLIATPYCIAEDEWTIGYLSELFFYNFTLCFVTWGGCVLIGNWSNKIYSWEDDTIKRIVFQFGLSAIFSVIAVNAMISLFFLHWMHGYPLAFVFKWESSLLAIFITFFIISADAGSYFFKNWRSALVESEKLKKETIQSQFEALKTQINPHFLFNSLNTLAAIIPEDKNKSVEFVEKLSKVYRYLMQYRNYDTVELKTEVNCVEAYFFLQQTRFGDSLKTEIDIDENLLNMHLPPLCLQILAENAIKHNIVSSAKPLTIKIYTTDNTLVVENNLQLKSVIEQSTKVGLANIQKRYQYIGNTDILIEETNSTFTVKLPLLKDTKK